MLDLRHVVENLEAVRAQLARRSAGAAASLDTIAELSHRRVEVIKQLEALRQEKNAANDAMAIGCLAALKERGVKVPGEVALAGFDDIPISRFMAPPLTSVKVSIADLGARALERLHAAVEAGDAASSALILMAERKSA